MKRLLIYLTLFCACFCISQKKGNFPPNLDFVDVMKLQDVYLVKSERYVHKKRRDVRAFFYYKDSVGAVFSVKPNFEVMDICETADFYYSILRGDTHAELFRSPKKDLDWHAVFTIDKLEDDYSFAVCKDGILLFTNDGFYDNFKNGNEFGYTTWSDSGYGAMIFNNGTRLSPVGNDVYLANDRGEFGGEAVKLSYDKKSGKFRCKYLYNHNTDKIVLAGKTVYLLNANQYTSSLYKIEDDKLVKVFFQSRNFKSNGIEVREDTFGWGQKIGNSMLENIAGYKGKLYVSAAGRGIFEVGKNQELKQLVSLDIDDRYRFDNGNAPFEVVDELRDFRILDKQIFVIHSIPKITRLKIP